MLVLHACGGLPQADREALFAARRLRTIQDAARLYVATIDRGVDGILRSPDGTDLAPAFAELSKTAREEVEMTLGSVFSDRALVQRLATEVINACR